MTGNSAQKEKQTESFTAGIVLGLIGAIWAMVIGILTGIGFMWNPYMDQQIYMVISFINGIIALVGALYLRKNPKIGTILLIAGALLGIILVNTIMGIVLLAAGSLSAQKLKKKTSEITSDEFLQKHGYKRDKKN